MPKNIFVTVFVIFIITYLPSCIPFKKTLILKENDDQKEKEVIEVSHDFDNYKIQNDDFIRVNVISPDKESVAIFNISPSQYNNSINNISNDLRQSYQVENNGNIRLPIIGDVKVSGLTLIEVRDTLQSVFSTYYKFVTIKVELVSFNVTFIGEVKRPGQTRVYTENTNFFQAMSNAGGQTNYANNQRVKLLRKTDTSVEVHYLDISSINFISSEFYYLKPSDIVYIEPLKAKSQRDNLFLVSLFTSITGLTISLIALLK